MKKIFFVIILVAFIVGCVSEKKKDITNSKIKYYKSVLKYNPCASGEESFTYFLNFPPPDTRIYVIQIRKTVDGKKKLYFEGTDRIGGDIFAPDLEAILSDEEFENGENIFNQMFLENKDKGENKNLGRVGVIKNIDGNCVFYEDFCVKTKQAFDGQFCDEFGSKNIKVGSFFEKSKIFIEGVFKNNKTVIQLKNYN